MGKTQTARALFLGMVLLLAYMTLGTPPTSYAQSAAARKQNYYFIQGAVKKPGVYEIESAPSLLKLITVAGGLNDNHGSTALIIRRLPARGADAASAFKVIQISIKALFKGEFGSEVYLEPGDIVNIPQTEVVSVLRATGARSVPFRQGLTLVQALGFAKAFSLDAKIEGIVIFRLDPVTGNRQEIKIDLPGMLRGAERDIALEPNDMIVVESTSVLWPRAPRPFLDIPTVRDLAPCRGIRPCTALLAPSRSEQGYKPGH